MGSRDHLHWHARACKRRSQVCCKCAGARSHSAATSSLSSQPRPSKQHTARTPARQSATLIHSGTDAGRHEVALTGMTFAHLCTRCIQDARLASPNRSLAAHHIERLYGGISTSTPAATSRVHARSVQRIAATLAHDGVVCVLNFLLPVPRYAAQPQRLHWMPHESRSCSKSSNTPLPFRR